MLALVAMTPLLSACAGASSSPAPVVTVRCGTVAALSAEQQRAAAAELGGLPAAGVVRSVLIPDYGRMRDEARACRGAR